ncbi:MAG: single-stranded-DNA-specific exonuclease RecJ [Parvibaculaceae bacterium]
MSAIEKFALGVTRSVTGRAWRLREVSQRDALAISERHGIPELLGRVLAGRNVLLDDVPGYLSPTLKNLLPDPSVLADMDRAVERIVAAVTQGEGIGIIGDYDVDGMSSTALLAEFLERAGVKPAVHLPDRLREGYGPSLEAVARLAGQGVGLLVTLDCGTSAEAAIAAANELGMDCVVVDHHLPGPALPRAHAVVNPRRQDDISGLDHLSAAGITFLLLVGLSRALKTAGHWTSEPPDLLAALDLVALATVCDVVPLTGLNRAFVTQGLKVMARRERVGLAALADMARLSRAPDPHALGFVLGPRLNAAGRIGDAALGLRLLLTRDRGEANVIAQELEKLNRERQSIELAAVEEAYAQADAGIAVGAPMPILFAQGESWHPGVLGLVASRLRERYGVPAFALAPTREEGLLSGSGRSVAGFDLGRAVAAAVEAGLLVKGGGHAMAAGLTARAGDVEALKAFLASAVGEPAQAAPWLDLEGALSAGGATADLVALLARAGPYGSGNPEPVFAFPAHRVAYADAAGSDHVRCTLVAGDGSRLKAIAFRSMGTELGEMLLSERALPLHVAGRLCLDTWNGRRDAQLLIEDVAEIRA